MGHNLVSCAGPVGDAPVKRLDRQAAGRVSGYQRVEPPPQSVNLDDVP